MVSTAAIVAAVTASRAAARRREEDARRRRRAEEQRRQRAAAEQKRKKEEENRRRRREEEERRRRQEHKKKFQLENHNYRQKQKENTHNASLSAVYEFTSEMSVKYEDLPIAHRGAYESILADGSRLSNMDNQFVRTYPDGRVQEYNGDHYSGYKRMLILTKEELPNGAMIVYNTSGKKLYERDEQGNYTYHKTDSNGKIIETIEGKISSEPAKEFTSEMSVKYEDLPIAHRGAYESILADGSRLSSMDNRFVRTYPDGRVQEYNGDHYSGYKRMLILTKEELPNGAMVVYNTSGKKLYERDEQGNYTYHKTDSNGKIIETIEGKISSEPAKEFTSEMSVKYEDLPIAHRGAYESILADGSRLSSMDNRFVRTYPDGRVQEYNGDHYSGYKRMLILTKEELPNGAMVVYNTSGKKLYERDEQGNYTYHKTDSNGKIIETIEGKISSEPAKEFTSEMSVKYEDLPIAHRGAYESILADGSRLSSMDNRFVRTYPDGRVQEYNGDHYSGYKRMLILTKEELPNGAMVVYNTSGKKLYERDEQGNYTYHKTDSNGKIIETIEVKDEVMIKTFYDKEGNVSYYVKGNEPHKKYHPSGKLYEETKEDNSCYRYDENGFCIYEQNADGEYFKYQPISDGKDRLLIEKGKDNDWSEKYVYYPSGQLKEEYYDRRSGACRKYTENGVCLYEKLGNGYSFTYQLAPNGKDRLLVEKEEGYGIVEKHSYYSNGKIKESKYVDGSYVVYEEDGTYKKFDGHARLKEETDVLGKTTYTHYGESNQIEHVTRYDVNGNRVEAEYKHFDKEGKEDTAYYLAMKRIIARKIEKADEKQAKEGVPVAERKVSKKMSKPAKLLAHLKAKIESRNG